MLLGIYLKSRPKNKWSLVSIATTSESAKVEMEDVLKQSQKEGNEKAEVNFQLFENANYIPHFLSEIKDQKLIYN